MTTETDSTTEQETRGTDARAEPLLSVSNLQTYYGESHILRGVSFDIYAGEVVALLGRNGVGKTTTLRSILQHTPPREGSVRYRGEELTGQQPHEIADRGIGWIPEERRVFSSLTVGENIRIAVSPSDTDRAHHTAYRMFPALERVAQQTAGTLSGGQQQMLAIARGLVGTNDLLLIDEPSEGLAPQIVTAVAESIAAAAAERTIVLVEQNLPLALDLADRYYVLDTGQVVASGDTDGVSADDETLRGYLSA